MRWSRLFVALPGATLLLLCGCTEHQDAVAPTASPQVAAKSQPAVSADNATAKTAPPVMADNKSSPNAMPDGNGVPPAGNAPFAGGAKLTAEEALKQVPALDPKFAPMQKTMDESEAALKKSPNDPKLKEAYVNTTYNYGHTLVVGPTTAPQTVQYRAALALYRRALKVDPKHQPSLEDKKMIEDIYTQMGREIPK